MLHKRSTSGDTPAIQIKFITMIALFSVDPNEPIVWPMVIFAMFFSLGLALFYTLFIGNVGNVTIRPRWLFYALLPAIVGLCGSIKTEWSFIAIVGLFGLLALIVISISVITALLQGFASIRQYFSDKKAGKLKKKPFVPLWQKLLSAVAIIALLTAFFSGVHYFIIALTACILISSLLPSAKSTFLKLQADLPTSKIRSLAMGLVEVKGRVAMGEPLKAPLSEKDCIGYRYTIEDISKDDEGKESFSITHDETICHRFAISDGTGSIPVRPEGITFVWVALNEAYRAGGRRHSQYLLLDGDDVILIGNASLENNQPVIELDALQNVLSLSPINSMDRWNTYKPLLNGFITCNALLALSIAVALMVSITIKNKTVTIAFDKIISMKNSDYDTEQLSEADDPTIDEAADPDAALGAEPAE
jgi:hypothetical protein